MEFSDEVLKQAFIRAEGKCECVKGTHKHPKLSCGHSLSFEKRGMQGDKDCWDAVQKKHTDHGGDFSLNNCQIICCECKSRP